MAWVGLVDTDTMLVNPVAHSGVEEGYLKRIRISVGDKAEDRGPIGNAMRESKYFLCNDIQNDLCILPWREEALKRGYRSSVVFPIKVNERVAGALNIYASEPNFFDEEEVELVKEIAADISYALESMEHEEERKKAEGEIKKRVKELEEFYEMAVGRELKMKELKEKIAKLEAELSKHKKGNDAG